MTDDEAQLLDQIAAIEDLQLRGLFLHLNRSLGNRIHELENDQAILRQGFNVLRWALPFAGTILGVLIGKGVI